VDIGARIGHFELLGRIGKGGMGEVWRARDTRLRRDVAVKTLPDSMAADPVELARLTREAELLAALNHPHIATIHGIEEQAGARFLILELVEGDTLDDRLRRGAVPVDQALAFALQMAEALETAHRAGIVHRDLKPANIKITPDQRIKVLDFGIAKALAPATDLSETRAHDPTQTGVIIGTPAYMSPEQARGEPVGVQADIWAFGVVFYEMLAGRPPFTRPTTAETLASVLESQPDFDALPPTLPSVARRLVARCLEKDRSRRMHDMGDVRILLEDARAEAGAEAPPPQSAESARRSAWAVAGVVAGVAALLSAGTTLWLAGGSTRGGPPPAPVYASVPFPERPAGFPFGQRYLAVSADGSTIAHAGGRRLWIRRLDQKEAVSVETGPSSNPFFSPDGEWVAVFTETALVKVPARGGPYETILTTTDRPAGGAWRADGTIVYATTEGVYEVAANGGERKLVASPDRSRNENLYAFPHALPGGQSILMTVAFEDASQPTQVAVLDVETGARRTLLTGSSARFLAPGYLVYASGSVLNAVAFDAATATLTGKPVSFPDVELEVAADNGAANFAVSEAGTLIVAPPPRRGLRTLEWVDRTGRRDPLPLEPREYGYAMVSPDGSRVAVERTTRGNRDIWILDLARLTQTQLTDGPTEDMLPIWSADGARVYFASRRSGNFDLYSQAADGASEARLEYAGPELQVPSSVTPDGRQMIVYDRFQDLALLDFARPDRLEPLLNSAADERLAEVSPDGKWVAYESEESGNQFEVIIRSFPDTRDRREIVSAGGGRFPRWGPPGTNELYYVRPDGAMMAVPITLSPSLTIGPGTKLFDWVKPGGRSGRYYDVAPDGRFLVSSPTEPVTTGPLQVSVVLNWLTSLRNNGR